MSAWVDRFAAFWRMPGAAGRKVDPVAIAIFYAVACLWSFAMARYGDFRLPGGGEAPRVAPAMLVGFGPLLGALVAGSLRRDPALWPAGFRGRARRWTLAALLLPVAAGAAVGVDRFHIDPHVDGAAVAATILLAAIGEEIGWREWLYNALAGRPPWQAAIVTWLLWLAWHLPIAGVLGLSINPGLAVALLAASFALAALVRSTGASALAAAWHAAATLALPTGAAIAAVLLLAAATALAVREARAQPLSRMSR